jgi:hypothetical protein
MATTEAIGEGLTFEKVWAAIQATNEQIKSIGERMKATDEQLKAVGEFIKAVGEEIKANNEQMKETDKRMGKLDNRFGETVEYLVAPNLVAKFKELGFEFEKSHRNTEIKSQEHNIFTEIDVFLENGDKAMVVETKVKPSVGDINYHIERMEKLRRYADLHNDNRKYLGAIAGVVFGDNEKTYALKQGFYVIEPSGDTFTIIEPKGDCHPHEW